MNETFIRFSPSLLPSAKERIEDAVYELYDSAGPARGYLDMKEAGQR